jgi:hypothetical protein
VLDETTEGEGAAGRLVVDRGRVAREHRFGRPAVEHAGSRVGVIVAEVGGDDDERVELVDEGRHVAGGRPADGDREDLEAGARTLEERELHLERVIAVVRGVVDDGPGC